MSSFHRESNSNNADSPSARFHTTSLLDTSIAAAIEAVQSIYRAQVNRLAMIHAASQYQARLAAFELLAADEKVAFETIIVISLLLCLCEIILPNEDGPAFQPFGLAFEARLAVWLLNTDRSPMALRICVWLQLLHVATKRSGCRGMLPETMFQLLNDHITEVPNLPPLSNSSDSTKMLLAGYITSGLPCTLQARLINPTAWNWRGKAAFLWAGTNLIGIVWTYFRLPEPKGLTFADIDVLFERRVPAHKFSKIAVDPYHSHGIATIEEEENVGDDYDKRKSSWGTSCFIFNLHFYNHFHQ
ncbi:uncharacterized protein Triagg1_9667 [Trichoderma aggressivum f. europaeum]|uniref:Uncharacterized protein n=1 Tax=Trichoderma aggressivum f. europaeum TaxID=173218 RepID=A0AAE1LWX4_9HYPO|nr:hypothetical protein Triagg1_9667 [Trichoderma aggressivum f. europaeum]